MHKTEQITSINGKCRLVMQGDGNLVAYNANRKPFFASNTPRQPENIFEFRKNGNLVVMAPNGAVRYSSNTEGLGGEKLIIEDDCGIFLVDENCNIIYTFPHNLNKTTLKCRQAVVPNNHLLIGEKLLKGENIKSTNGKCELKMQNDGNLVLYDHSRRTRKAKFASKTSKQPNNRFEFRNNGDLVVVNSNNDEVRFASNTSGLGGVKIILENDCNVNLFNSDCNIVYTFPHNV